MLAKIAALREADSNLPDSRRFRKWSKMVNKTFNNPIAAEQAFKGMMLKNLEGQLSVFNNEIARMEGDEFERLAIMQSSAAGESAEAARRQTMNQARALLRQNPNALGGKVLNELAVSLWERHNIRGFGDFAIDPIKAENDALTMQERNLLTRMAQTEAMTVDALDEMIDEGLDPRYRPWMVSLIERKEQLRQDKDAPKPKPGEPVMMSTLRGPYEMGSKYIDDFQGQWFDTYRRLLAKGQQPTRTTLRGPLGTLPGSRPPSVIGEGRPTAFSAVRGGDITETVSEVVPGEQNILDQPAVAAEALVMTVRSFRSDDSDNHVADNFLRLQLPTFVPPEIWGLARDLIEAEFTGGAAPAPPDNEARRLLLEFVGQ